MSLEDNNGTQYYGISCGIPSGIVDIASNIGSEYYWLSANDYILYGQPAAYPGLEFNNTRFEYLYRCNVPSDVGLDIESNNGTKYFYSSSFNCISFCPVPAVSLDTIQSAMGEDITLVWDEWKLDSGVATLGNNEFDSWTGSLSGNIMAMKPDMLSRNRSIVYGDHIEINGLSQALSSRFMVLSCPDFGGSNPRARKTFWVMETNFRSASGISILSNCPLASYTSSFDYTYVSYVSATSALNQYIQGGVYSTGQSLSSLLSGGTHTYILETGSLDNGGGINLNGITIPSDGSSVYWSRDQWSLGTFRWNPSETQYNTMRIKLKAIVFMKHPNPAIAIPLSATQKVRDYLTFKYGVTS